ncbi:MAG: hypothetical protein GJT30_17760 [Geobacter sp.]|nr:hypothetical protein [Geobacter sp.]
MKRLPLLTLVCLLMASPLQAQDAVQEKIKLLEQQIQELKALKAQQDLGKKKAEQCLKAVGREKFCSCLGENLPASVSFEQYIHTLVSSKEELGYGALPAEQQKMIDAILETREKCVEKGFFN